MFLSRILNLQDLLQKKSFFLFGPRSTGKTSLIRNQLGDSAYVVDLLKSDFFLRLSNRPSELEQIARESKKEIIVIDEVQKLPILLDEVHRLIEETKLRFLLTGSSARKLKRENANLLAGRAWKAELFPFTSSEILEFDLSHYLLVGGLPQVYGSSYPHEELDSYVGTYLREEIQAEAAVRDLARFSRFLLLAAQTTGEIMNFSNIASDVGSAPSTVIEYFRILEDTLLGFVVEPWGASKKRKEISAAKFYLFDTGVTNTLRRVRSLDRASDLYGKCFEQFIAMELKAAISYKRLPVKLSFWRTYDKHEVDFVIENLCAIEVKATTRASERDGKSLRLLNEEGPIKNLLFVSQDPVERINKGIRFIHYETFLKELWAGELLS